MRSITHHSGAFARVLLFSAGVFLYPLTTEAVPREAGKNDGAMLKLQAMVKSLTAERDAAKAESAAMLTELEELKKDKQATLAAKDSLSSELAVQKNSVGEFRSRLGKTESRLQEVSSQLSQTSQAKSDLDTELTALKAKQQATEQQLQTCGTHNAKLSQSAQELLERYQSKGTWVGLLQDEPLLQFQSVEIQNIVQEYQDKINADQQGTGNF
ncbi:MAG: hypothetical protein CTY19_16990 [Methylomonas sp.]|jgi:chromosome segregation ATPase|nr:MAG: hypothetical protein CTY19_16990 [Methylomonas sp.]